MPNDYLSVDEMTKEFEISRSTAWKWIRDGDIPTYRFVGDRKTYVKRADLEKLREPIPILDAKKEVA
jgi:excisionase family DNA binding protein